MYREVKRFWLKVSLLLMLASSLASCQSGLVPSGSGSTHPSRPSPTLREQACATQFHPRVTVTNTLAATTHLLYFSDASRIYALNAGNGTFRWCIQLAHSPEDASAGSFIHFFQLTLNNGRLYGDGDDSYTYAFDAATGSLLWSYNAQALQTDTHPIVVNNIVYSGTSSLYALNAQNGHVLWQYLQDGAQQNQPQTIINRLPAVDQGTIYLASSSNGEATSYLQAIDAATGAKRWIIPQHPDPHFHIGSDPFAANGMVFFVLNGKVTAVNAQDGNKKLWQSQQNVSNLVAASNNVLYAVVGDNTEGNPGTILALSMRDGSVLWSVPQPDALTRLRFLATSTHLYVTGAHTIYVLNTTDGSISWQKQLENVRPVMTAPAFGNGELYVGSLSNDNGMLLHALNAQTGSEDWYVDAPQSAALFGTYQAIAV